MIQRRSSRELIKTSLYELLQGKSIEQITVREIVKNCGVTTRAFYNNFIDKHDAVSQIYLSEMKPYLQNSLAEWCERRSELLMDSPGFFRNCICYSGQNSLLEVIQRVDQEKYMMHIRLELDSEPALLRLVQQGITYFIHGNIGLLKESYDNNIIIREEEYICRYQNTWQLMSIWVPQIVRDNLCEEPVRKPSKELVRMMGA